MTSRHRPNTSMSARSTQRPDSRASTTSATSQNDDEQTHRDIRAAPATYINNPGPEAALLQYHANIGNPPGPVYDMSQHRQPINHHQHAHSASFSAQGGYASHESSFMQADVGYSNHVRMGSAPVQSGTELQDDKRRKGSAVTATNDKELREMLAKNEGRPLRDVAQEVIQKERTPMAEKTKQLFAMLW